MALTLQQILEARELLAEHNFLLEKIEDEVVSSANGTLVRYVEGIPEPSQDICRLFLQTIISAGNAEVVEIAGPLAPYDLMGEYFDTHATAAGQVVRKTANDDYTLQAIEGAGSYHWQLSNEWDEILYTSNAQAGEPVDLNDAVWTAIGKVYVNLTNSRVMEDWFQTDSGGPYYTTTGAASSTGVAPSAGVYATVKDPMAESKIRGGTYRGGKVWTERQQNGTWTIFQTLHILNEVHVYIKTGLRKTIHMREEERLYERIPEAHMDTLIEQLAVRGEFAVADVRGRKTGTAGVFDITLTVISVTGSGYLLVGRKLTENSTEETRLYYSVPEDEVTDRITDLSNLPGYAVVDSTARKTKWEGVFDVYLTLISVNGGKDYIKIGRENTANTHEETRLYQFVKESEVSSLVESLSALGNYAVVDVISSKTKWDAVFDIRVTLLTVNDGGSVTQVGKAETAYTLETTLLYPRVKQASVADVINGTALNGYVRVGSRASRTRWDGVFDVFVTMRLLKAAGAATLIGSRTPGFIRRDVYLIRNVADAEVADIVSGLAGQDLVEDVRSSRTGEPGFRDVFYTQMVLPAAYTEYRSGVDRRQSPWETATHNVVTGLAKVLTDVHTDAEGKQTLEYSYFSRKYKLPQHYFWSAGEEWRLNTQVIVVIYSASQPPAPNNSFSGNTGNGGTVERLPNGLWVMRQIATSYDWWTG